MGESNSVYVFKGPELSDFRDAVQSAVAALGGHLDWEARPQLFAAKMLTSHNERVHAAYIDVAGFEIAKSIGVRLGIPWINVRIQQGALWDYSLYQADSHLDNFSTLPEYWESDPIWLATQRGNPGLLAATWSIEQAAIERYLQPWGYKVKRATGEFRTTLRGKAYPNDSFEHGDIWQMTDFLRALGAHDPNFDQPHCVPRGLELDRDVQGRNRT